MVFCLAAILDKIFWNFASFQKRFHSPQVKRYFISSIKSNRTTEELGSQEIRKYYEKIQIVWKQSLMPRLPPKNNNFVIAAKDYAEVVIRVLCFYPISRFCSISLLCFENFVKLYDKRKWINCQYYQEAYSETYQTSKMGFCEVSQWLLVFA